MGESLVHPPVGSPRSVERKRRKVASLLISNEQMEAFLYVENGRKTRMGLTVVSITIIILLVAIIVAVGRVERCHWQRARISLVPGKSLWQSLVVARLANVASVANVAVSCIRGANIAL